MGWASGELGLFTKPAHGVSSPPASPPRNGRSPSEPEDTNDAKPSTSSPAYDKLIESVSLFGCVGIGVAAMQLLCILYWKWCINRQFYAEMEQSRTDHLDANVSVQQSTHRSFSVMLRRSLMLRRSFMLRRSLFSGGVQTKAGTQYKAFPGIFVFPNLLLVACKIFITGLAASATSLAMDMGAHGPCASTTCRLVSVGSLSGALLYTLWGWLVILDFSCRFRTSSWTAATPPQTPDEIKDPFFRLLNRVRRRSVRLHARALTDRAQGTFAKPTEEAKEPERTERLLRQIFRLRRRTAADTLDAYQFAFFPRSNGARAINLFFDHGGITVTLLIAVLSGVGSHLDTGTHLAAIQVAAIGVLQLLYALYCYVYWPSADKADAFMLGTQYLIESVRTGLLLLQLPLPNAATELRRISFILSLLAIGVPLLRFMYDGVLVPLITLRRGNKLNVQAAWVGMIMFLIHVQKLLRNFAPNLGGGSDVQAASGGAENIGKMQKNLVEQGILVNVATDVLADAEDMHNVTGPWNDETPMRTHRWLARARETRAATRIQRCFRQHRRRAAESKIQGCVERV